MVKEMTIWYKIYEAYFMKSHFPLYKMILEKAKENGYLMMGILDFAEHVKHHETPTGGYRILVNRHDIDTSAKTAWYFRNIEMSVYGEEGSASYYFRKDTCDRPDLIKQLMDDGYEPSFHYETIADWEKKHKTKSRERIIEAFPEIKRIFVDELSTFKQKTGCECRSVASHGDFINRTYKLTNLEILHDDALRAECGIEVEAYDSVIADNVTCRFADQDALSGFVPSVLEAIEQHAPVISLLTHPVHWKTDWFANTANMAGRVIEGISYRI